jgi:RNA polymerase sigma factor (sigma-70 family)
MLACAQAGCERCLDAVIRENEGLIHAVLQRTHRCSVPYDDLVQEGRIALWRAVRGFDGQRGIAFSTYAWVAIERHLWRAIRQVTRSGDDWVGPEPVAWLDEVLLQVWRSQVSQPLLQAVSQLPPDLREVIIASYGLNGEDPCSLAAQGRLRGVSGERIRQVRNDALVLLRLPVLAGRLHQVCGQNTRPAQARMRALNQAWLSRRRRKRRQP